jgi:hypothetical protein
VKREHTLRYLLLRHFKAFADRVPADLLIEVTHNLRVSVDREGYVVRWRAHGAEHERVFPRDAFVFYRPGDSSPEQRSVDEPLEDQNSARARAFGAEVFGVPAPPLLTGAAEPRDAFARYGVVEAILLGLALWTCGSLTLIPALTLVGLYLIEYTERGRPWAGALWLALALVGPPAAAFLGASSYALLQFLDPDPTGRTWRAASCAAAAVVAVIGLVLAHAGIVVSLGAIVVAVAAVAGAILRSLFASHLRAMPLALPFYSLGLFLDGHRAAALVGLAVVLLSILAASYAHHWAPVQREQRLTPNG